MLKIKIDKTSYQKVWITSDTHYNHKNICRGVTNWRLPNGEVPEAQNRNFKNLELMNDVIVNTINGLVAQDDILIHLGDWSFGGFEMIEEFRNRIFCKNIHLILGNHDHHIERNKGDVQKLFTSVSHYTTLQVNEHTFKIMHYPISSWDGMDKGIAHLHGHCHLPTHLRFGRGKRMDVGMDGHPEFRPYDLLREIVPIMSKREIASDMNNDHHLDEIENKIG